jgi:hypothetical protein
MGVRKMLFDSVLSRKQSLRTWDCGNVVTPQKGRDSNARILESYPFLIDTTLPETMAPTLLASIMTNTPL